MRFSTFEHTIAALLIALCFMYVIYLQTEITKLQQSMNVIRAENEILLLASLHHTEPTTQAR